MYIINIHEVRNEHVLLGRFSCTAYMLYISCKANTRITYTKTYQETHTRVHQRTAVPDGRS
jgi:hypothetical protein